MTQITRKQHFVPQFYLRQWAGQNGEITCHDLQYTAARAKSPKSVLYRDYLYEEDPQNPDSRVEDMLGEIETKAAPVFAKIAALGVPGASDTEMKAFGRTLVSALSSEDLDALVDFIVCQYIRVPGAIDQKDYELQGSNLTAAQREYEMNPGRFVDGGFQHLSQKFRAMKMIALISPGREFITADWPCFDIKDHPDQPALGIEIGVNPEVVCYFPLTPRVGLVLKAVTPVEAEKLPRLLPTSTTDITVRNQNTLVVQQAEQLVVASRSEPYIFKIAAKRKKGRIP